MPRNKVRIAAVQFDSRAGAVSQNLETARMHLGRAVEAGAELVLFPEFMSIGYDMSPACWQYAETIDGPTTSWLRTTCTEYGVWAGTSILETDGRDMLNTFVLVGPDGEIAGAVRKSHPAAAEAYRFRGVAGTHVIETPLGRIGVGICYESLFRSWAHDLARERPDVVLLSFSGPVPSTSRFNPPENGEAFVALLDRAPGRIARMLGVPVAYANKVGRWQSKMPWPLPDEDSSFPGGSKVVDGTGRVIDELGGEPGIVVADIEPGLPGNGEEQIPEEGRWNQPVPDFFRLFTVPELLGRVAYSVSHARRRLARFRYFQN